MAIPFNVPEEAVDDRNVVRIPICEIIRHFVQPEVLEQESRERPLVIVLPEIHRNCPGRKTTVPPRRRRRRPEKNAEEPKQTLNLGIQLRQIEELTTQSVGQIKKKRKETKSSSFFSLLLPAPIPGSIWTTVIILVGWRILTRQR